MDICHGQSLFLNQNPFVYSTNESKIIGILHHCWWMAWKHLIVHLFYSYSMQLHLVKEFLLAVGIISIENKFSFLCPPKSIFFCFVFLFFLHHSPPTFAVFCNVYHQSWSITYQFISVVTKLDDQVFVNKNVQPPSCIRFHPYEPHFVTTDTSGVRSVYQFSRPH